MENEMRENCFKIVPAVLDSAGDVLASFHKLIITANIVNFSRKILILLKIFTKFA